MGSSVDHNLQNQPIDAGSGNRGRNSTAQGWNRGCHCWQRRVVFATQPEDEALALGYLGPQVRGGLSPGPGTILSKKATKALGVSSNLFGGNLAIAPGGT